MLVAEPGSGFVVVEISVSVSVSAILFSSKTGQLGDMTSNRRDCQAFVCGNFCIARKCNDHTLFWCQIVLLWSKNLNKINPSIHVHVHVSLF